MKSKQYSGRNLAMDVTFDGENYIISNIKDLEGTNSSNTISFEEKDPAFIVSPDKVEKDRNTSTSTNKTNSQTSSSNKKMTVNEFTEYLKEVAKNYDSDTSKMEVKRFMGTIFIVNTTKGIHDVGTLAVSGNTTALNEWNELIASAVMLSTSVRERMDEEGLKSYDIAVDIMDDTNTEMVLAEVRNGVVEFDGVNGIDNR